MFKEQIGLFKRRSTLPNVFEELGYKVGCEVGTFKGNFAVIILNGCKTLEKLHVVDPWGDIGMPKKDPDSLEPEKVYEIAKENLKPFSDRVIFHRKTSLEASREFEDRSLDFVYIDAIHDEENVTLDIKLWLPKVKLNGCVGGHDYNKNFPKKGVTVAVHKIFGKEVAYYTHEARNKSWYVFLTEKFLSENKINV